jgi:hypothetical protein
MEIAAGPAERRRGADMDCPTCRDLKRAYETGLSEYIEALSSAMYRISTRLAAYKNVEMERARSALEEHCLVCVSAGKVIQLLPERDASMSRKPLAA